ncbi:hypothetical protein Q5P01_004643 [Channa striata]|nr:hypothetical protein Q5P01_004643 [Channa striata]
MDDTTADPEDAVTYVSITYTKKTKNKVQTQEDAEVTYSTVKARSSAAAEVSTEPDIVYAAVNKPKT